MPDDHDRERNDSERAASARDGGAPDDGARDAGGRDTGAADAGGRDTGAGNAGGPPDDDSRRDDPPFEPPREPGGGAPESAPRTGAAPHEGEAVADYFSLREVFHRVLATADEELSRPNRLLFWSAFAGGLVLGLSLLARVSFMALTPSGDPRIGNLLYPVGFVILILGRYQLFTENTLTPVTLVLTRLATVRDLLRLWTVVYVGNLLGGALFVSLLGPLHVLTPEAATLALEVGRAQLAPDFVTAFGRAMVAGWLLGVIVWLVHAARETVARIVLIWGLIYLQGTARLYHSIVGALEALYALVHGEIGASAFLGGFLVPVTLGNIVGGVVFVALLNFVQLGGATEEFAHRGERLSVRRWLFGRMKS